MYTKEDLKQAITELIEDGEELRKLVSNKEKTFVTFSSKYQIWYTKSLRILEFLAKDRLGEFKSFYEADPKRKEYNMVTYVIQDFCLGLFPTVGKDGKPKFNSEYIIFSKLHNQINILESLETRIESVFSDVRGVILSDIFDKELEEAKKLLKINIRAAGSLAGVVLESHLAKVAQNHLVTLSKKDPTISDFNDVLKQKNVYDVPVWRKIQYLGDIRNLCSHKKETEPNMDQVKDLINGVNELIKTLF